MSLFQTVKKLDSRYFLFVLIIVLITVISSCLPPIICKKCVPSRVWINFYAPYLHVKWDDLIIKIDPPAPLLSDSAAGYYAMRLPSTWSADSCTFIRRNVPTPLVPEEWNDDAAVWMGDTLAMTYDVTLSAQIEIMYPSGGGENWWVFKSEYVDSTTWGEAMPDTAAGKVQVWITTDIPVTAPHFPNLDGDIYYIDALPGDTYNGWADPDDGGRWDFPIMVNLDQEFLDVTVASFTACGCRDRVQIEWATASEVDITGFNIYRSFDKDSPRAQLNTNLIPARGDELEGSFYTFSDQDVVDGNAYYYWLESIDIQGKSKTEVPIPLRAGSSAECGDIPTSMAFSLSQNNPNPFNPTTEIQYNLPENCHVRLDIFNVLGQKVAALVDEHQGSGSKVARWDGKNDRGIAVSGGVYFYKLEAGSYSNIKKMVLVK